MQTRCHFPSSACISTRCCRIDSQQLLNSRTLLLSLQEASPGSHQDQMCELAALDQVFQAAKHNLKAGEPASAFTCPLTMEVFRDPVMAPSGLSYERSALLEHLRKVRHHPHSQRSTVAQQMSFMTGVAKR